MDVRWQRLIDAAHEAMEHAYAPYSNYPVGAAALVSDGRIVSVAMWRTPRTASRSAPNAV